MNITDELRKWLKSLYTPNSGAVKDEGERIADRIDAEHEAKVAYWQEASYRNGYDEGFASADDWLADHEDTMAEHGWIKLPVDADGVPIRVGDVMEWAPYDDTYQPVIRTVSGVGADVFFAWSGEKCNYAQYDAQAYRHHKQPTVEDVLREFASAYDRIGGEDDEHQKYLNLIAEYAAKLRLAKEGNA